MANYFVINNKFKPYSFDELIKPYQIYGQAYKEQEALIDAAREAEFSPENLDKTLDAPAYNMYTNVTNELRAASDELATRGLSTNLRGRIRTSARDYKRTMDSLTEAQKKLDAERTRRANLGPDYVYQQDDIRIGDFLNGATPNQKHAKLSDIANNVAYEFTNRAKAISKDTWGALFDGEGKQIKGFYDITSSTGLADAQLNAILALANPADWNKYVASNPNISEAQKEKLKGFVDTIKTEMSSVEFDKYNTEGQQDIWNAIVKGAHAGLGTTTHKYQQDSSYNPLGWATLNFKEEQYKDAIAAEESKWEHEPGKPISPATRTKPKEGYAYDSKGRLVWAGTGSSSSTKSSTNYVTTTPGITIHTSKGTKTYKDWDDARKDMRGGKTTILNGILDPSTNMETVAIGDIQDNDIKRALLSRINVPNKGKSENELNALIADNMDKLNQLTVQIKGTPDAPNYAWAISDKKVQRGTDYNEEEGEEYYDFNDEPTRGAVDDKFLGDD